MRDHDDARDTDPAAEAVLLELARTLSPARKLAIAAAMSRSLRRLAEAGVRSRSPAAGEDEVRLRLAAVLLPPELFTRVFGRDPDEVGY